ncbi:MAG: DUF362 domain-containing protein [Nanoarchaeota archaeon]
MARGVSIKFKSYKETVQNILRVTKFENELKKHAVVVLKPCLKNPGNKSNTPVAFTEAVLKFCLANKNPETQVFIAEGSDGEDTMETFQAEGYTKLSEIYSVGLIDLNTSETETIRDGEFIKFNEIHYPKILTNALIISIPKLSEDPETEISGSLSNFLGAFPAKHYSGFLSSNKNKIRKHPIKYSIHDILRCKLPQVAIMDASDKGVILLGDPIEVDKRASALMNKDWRQIQHIRLADESISNYMALQAQKEALKAQKNEEPKEEASFMKK